MKKFIVTILLLTVSVTADSQWISSFGSNLGDVSISDAKGQSLAVDDNDFSYVTGYINQAIGNNNIILIKYTQSGDTVWVRTYNGNAGLNDKGMDVCSDINGNVYVTGYAQFEGKANDVVVLKYSPEGTFRWVKQFSSSNSAADDAGTSLTVDGSNNVYVTGYTTKIDGYTDIFVMKIAPSGEVLWTKTEDGQFNFNSAGNGIAVSSMGNIYVTGYYSSSAANTNIAVIKYNSSGNLEWSKEINGSGNGDDNSWGIVVDDEDNIYVTGYTTALLNNIDCYTARFSSTGTLLWSRTYNGTGNQTDKAWGIVVDSDGSAYITGQTTSNNSNTDFLTIKYSSNGLMQWNSIYNGVGNKEDVSIGIDLLPNENNLFVTGKSWGTNNNYDFATIKYNTGNGNQSQVNIYSLSSNSQDIPTDIKSSKSGHIVVTGYGVNIAGVNETDSYISTISLNWGSEPISNTEIPSAFSLEQNYPNPFNPSTSIKFSLPDDISVKLAIYDVIGRVIDVLVERRLEAGIHTVSFNAMNLPSGIYFCKLEAGNYNAVKKMSLVK